MKLAAYLSCFRAQSLAPQGKVGRPVQVAVVGSGGLWAEQSWIPALRRLVRQEKIILTLVDRSDTPPAHLAGIVDGTNVIYSSWDTWSNAATDQCEVVIVVVAAADQRKVCLDLMRLKPSIRVVALEKPGGLNACESRQIVSAAKANGVRLVLADHYLLRNALRQFRQVKPKYLDAIGELTSMDAWLMESRLEGPPSSSAAIDLLPHLLNASRPLISWNRFVAVKTGLALSRNAPTGMKDSSCHVRGEVTLAGGPAIPLCLTVGKGLLNLKAVEIRGANGRIFLDLIKNKISIDCETLKEGPPSWGDEWSYEFLVHRLIGPEHLLDWTLEGVGGVPEDGYEAMWEELDAIMAIAERVPEFEPATVIGSSAAHATMS